MNKLLLLLFSIFIISCQYSKKSTEIDDGIPSWVKEYPVSESHYIGIGIADRSAHPQDYIKVAQQNALQNLSSQIKISISSQSVFLQIDREYSYEEDGSVSVDIKGSIVNWQERIFYKHPNLVVEYSWLESGKSKSARQVFKP